jgi:Zn-dependent peptidase ImmA (M78 family)
LRPAPLDSSIEIEAAARTLLRESRAFGTFPTPVEKVVQTAELKVAEGVDLSLAKPSYFSRAFEGIGKVSRKVLGLLDFRDRTIYLDLSQAVPRQRFIQLHEVGHDVLVWQGDAYRWDDEQTLDPFVKELFEKEASSFASAVLFQLDRFNEEAAKLPFGIKSAIALSKTFGASSQAAIRRYIQSCPKRCAVLVLEPLEQFKSAKVRNCFESTAFIKEFGYLSWPEECDLSFPFVQDMLRCRRLHEQGSLVIPTDTHGDISLAYHFFNNSFNSFVFLFPAGETIHSRTKILVTRT